MGFVGHGAGAAGFADEAGFGVLGADVGEFHQGGEGGAEGFGVLLGPLDGFPYGLLAGFAVGG